MERRGNNDCAGVESVEGFASIVMSPAVQMNRAIFPQHVPAARDLLEAVRVFPPPALTAARGRIVPGRV